MSEINQAPNLEDYRAVPGGRVHFSPVQYEVFTTQAEFYLERAKRVGDLACLASLLSEKYPDPSYISPWNKPATATNYMLNEVVDRYEKASWAPKDGFCIADDEFFDADITLPRGKILSPHIGVRIWALSTEEPLAVLGGRCESSVTGVERRFGIILPYDEPDQKIAVYYSADYEIEDFELDEALIASLPKPAK